MLKTAYVAYFLYVLAAIGAVSAFMTHSDLLFTFVNICIIALLYQTATSLLKHKTWAWWSAIIILAILCIAGSISIYLEMFTLTVRAGISEKIFYLRYNLILLVAYIISLFQLLKPITRNEYKPNY